MGITEQPGTDANSPSTSPLSSSGRDLAAPSTSLARQAMKAVVAALGSALICEPIPLTRPTVRADFNQVSTRVRILEALWYFFALIEYRVGPNGWFRAWLLLWLRVLLLITVPLLFLAGVVWLFVPVMTGLESVTESLNSIAHSLEAAFGGLFWACVYLVGIVLIVSALLAVLGLLRAKSQTTAADRRSKFVESTIQ